LEDYEEEREITMQKSLHDQRVYAAACAGGTSSSSVKALIVKIIKRERIKGNVLDYGAGQGELLNLLSHEGIFHKLSGADIFEKPACIGEDILWYQQDLNESLQIDGDLPNLVICSEVIEHLENPRATFRELHRLLAPGGHLILTMPNQESIRSFSGLFFGGHFTYFLGNSYPAHITALLKLDLERICEETGFSPPSFCYTDVGGIPKLPSITWQKVSFGLMRGRLFSDVIAMIAQKK
jgi:2-polyprenyl-3-methyl-5-hydroxy-6-metoxy-1,4-benzoquinol methylase